MPGEMSGMACGKVPVWFARSNWVTSDWAADFVSPPSPCLEFLIVQERSNEQG